MWFYHAQKALSMIFLKKNLKNQCTEYKLEYRCKILWCTVHYGSYCSADPCTAGDRPAERCRGCLNPPSRMRLKMPGKTKTSAHFHTLRFFGGRGWMSRAAHLKKPRRGFFARRTIRRADAVRIHPPSESGFAAKQKPQRTFIRWGLLVERSNPNPNHCPLGHLWRQSHRKWWFLYRLCSWM